MFQEKIFILIIVNIIRVAIGDQIGYVIFLIASLATHLKLDLIKSIKYKKSKTKNSNFIT